MTLKLLYIPLDYHRHTEDDRLFGDILRGFNSCFNARIYTTLDEAISFSPDVIFYQGSLSKVDCKRLKDSTGAFFTMWTGDARYAPPQDYIEFNKIVDQYFFPFSGPTLDFFSKILNRPCSYVYEPLHDWKVREPLYLDQGKITFVGNLYDTLPGGKDRLEIVEYLSTHVPSFECYGSIPNSKGQIPVESLPDLYNGSYAVIVENNIHDLDDYFTPRNLGAMAAGSCPVMRYFTGIEKFFTNLEDCLVYRHKYELIDILTLLIKNPNLRNRIAMNSYQSANSKWLCSNFAKAYLTELRLAKK
jgi:hypothetical protein